MTRQRCTQLVLLGCIALAAASSICRPSLAESTSMSPANANAIGFQGIWLGTTSTAWTDPLYRTTAWSPDPATMFTPWGARESKRLASPVTPGECNPYNPAFLVSGISLFPTLIAQAGDQLLITWEGTMLPRRIYMDGRSHPKDLDPTWEGDSVGHWEGDTLVVDTIGVNGKARPLNGYVAGAVYALPGDYAPRLPISEQMHMVERIRLVGNGDYLEDRITITDPKTYTGSFSKTAYYNRRPDLPYLEYVCTDNPRPEGEVRQKDVEKAAAKSRTGEPRP
jgi:hypothetical protein